MSAFEFGGGEKDVGRIVTSEFASVRVGEASQDRDLVPQGFKAFEAIVEDEITTFRVWKPIP